jgi:hypothetical protein
MSKTQLDTDSLNLTGVLSLAGAAQRVQGDFSNGTLAQRVAFQTNVTNGFTSLTVITNGTGTTSQANFHNTSAPDNSSYLAVGASATKTFINSKFVGSGSQLPISFQLQSVEVAVIDTNGNLLVGTSTSNGTDKLQVNGSATVAGFNVAFPGTSANAIQRASIFSGTDASSNEVRLQLNPIIGNTASQGVYVGASRNGTNYNSSLTLGTADTERARIDANGNLMIGTTAQANGVSKVTIAASSNGAAITVNGKSSSNVAPDIELARSSTATGVGQGTAIQFSDTGTNTNSRLIQAGAGSMQFFGYGGGGWAEHARIDINGQLGLGQISPSKYSHGGSAKLIEVLNTDTALNSQSHVILSTGATLASTAIGTLSFAMPSITAANKLVAYMNASTDASHTSASPSTFLAFATSTAGGSLTEKMRVDNGGNLLVGVTSGTCHTLSKTPGTLNALVLNVDNSTVFFTGNGSGYNAAAAAQKVLSNASTGRSINAAGTINASGADYAEYMTKADGCGVITKGQIVGVNADGKLTDKWADAVSFLIKSTDPSYVGGDVWGSTAALGMERPTEPALAFPEYTGHTHPGEAPVEPAAPELPEPVEPQAPADDADEEALAAYTAAHDQYLRDIEYYDQAHAEYEVQLADWHEADQLYQTALGMYQIDQQEHEAAVAAARAEFEQETYPAYQVALAEFETKLEEARQKVDRIAYCGQVPVNVTGATPGQYVVPTQDGEGIKGVLVNKADLTMVQYLDAVGVVQNILPDGRANVRVKTV